MAGPSSCNSRQKSPRQLPSKAERSQHGNSRRGTRGEHAMHLVRGARRRALKERRRRELESTKSAQCSAHSLITSSLQQPRLAIHRYTSLVYSHCQFATSLPLCCILSFHPLLFCRSLFSCESEAASCS
jgi:hypothetical protein